MKRVDIAPSGDLEIVTSATVIRVASQVLWTASPVFNAMFGPSSTYTEARKLKLATLEPDTRAVVTVDDDATALGAVLQVLHHRPVTSDFTFEELVKITEVTDKYQVAHVVKDKMERWVEKFDSVVLKSGYEDALTIAWVFKIDELFQEMTKELGSRTVFDQNGQLSLTDTSGQIIKFSDTLPEIVLGER